MASYFFFPILGWSNDAFYLVQIVKVWHSMLENPFLEALLLVKHAVHAQLCAYISLTEKINWVALPLLKLLYLLGVILQRVFCLRLPIFLLWSVKSHQVYDDSSGKFSCSSVRSGWRSLCFLMLGKGLGKLASESKLWWWLHLCSHLRAAARGLEDCGSFVFFTKSFAFWRAGRNMRPEEPKG